LGVIDQSAPTDVVAATAVHTSSGSSIVQLVTCTNTMVGLMSMLRLVIGTGVWYTATSL